MAAGQMKKEIPNLLCIILFSKIRLKLCLKKYTHQKVKHSKQRIATRNKIQFVLWTQNGKNTLCIASSFTKGRKIIAAYKSCELLALHI